MLKNIIAVLTVICMVSIAAPSFAESDCYYGDEIDAMLLQGGINAVLTGIDIDLATSNGEMEKYYNEAFDLAISVDIMAIQALGQMMNVRAELDECCGADFYQSKGNYISMKTETLDLVMEQHGYQSATVGYHYGYRD